MAASGQKPTQTRQPYTHTYPLYLYIKSPFDKNSLISDPILDNSERMMRTTTPFLCILFFCITACQEPTSTSAPTQIDQPATDFRAATLAMMEKVDQAMKKSNTYNLSPYCNSLTKLAAKKKMIRENPQANYNDLVEAANIAVNAGKIDESIGIYQSVLQQVNKTEAFQGKEDFILNVKRRLALAYLQKAEEDNCINNHQASSCIVPLDELAQHQDKRGAEAAITLLQEICTKFPDDQTAKYLLNFAYMALGKYPDQVPAKWKLSAKIFKDAANFKSFKNVAGETRTDLVGLAGGICIEDFNQDGYLDIIASSWGLRDQIRYLENDKAGKFIDKTQEAGLVGVTGGLNLQHADYNNDGFMDFLLLRGAWLNNYGKIPNSLFRNNGNGTFTDVTIEAGIYSEFPTQTAVWRDFNLDGWLDLFIGNESFGNVTAPCELFISDKNGQFTKSQNVLNITSFIKGVTSADINNDGYDDLYLSFYGGDNQLLLNKSQEADVKFVDITQSSQTAKPKASFPTWFFDFNNDGWEDIFVSGYNWDKSAPIAMLDFYEKDKLTIAPKLYFNNGDLSFTDITKRAGLAQPLLTMGCNFGDVDNDGFLDFYLATGEPNLESIIPNRMFRNVAGNRFEDISFSGGFGHIQKGHAVSFADLDNDGDQDIYAVMGGAFEGDAFQNILFENPNSKQNNWITIKLIGTLSNKSAIGARVKLLIDEKGVERSIYRTISTGASFGGNSLLCEMGIGKATKIKQLEIQWPNKAKSTQTFSDISINQSIQITEGQNDIKSLTLKSVPFAKGGHSHHHHHN